MKKNFAKAANNIPVSATVFLEGPAGSGKTTEAADYLRRLLDSGVAPERVLVLVPQRTLGRPYQLAAYRSARSGGYVETVTLGGIAYRAIETYWPILAKAAGFADPSREPTFLTIETAQYYMARFANPAIAAGRFEGVNIAPRRVISQTFDNLNKAATLRFSLDEVVTRLITAWGDRHSSRPPVYSASREIAEQFRAYCLEHNLIDFSLGIELLNTYLREDRRFMTAFFERYSYLIADNIEENNPSAHDFIGWMLPHLEGALLVYDSDAGYRFVLGADSESAYNLSDECDLHITRTEPHVASPAIMALTSEFNRAIAPVFDTSPNPISSLENNLDLPDSPSPSTETGPGGEVNPLSAFQFATHAYYPQMIEWIVEQITHLVKDEKVPAGQIAIIAPYLNDSLRFSLVYALEQAGVPTLSHRPSRALRDEPSARAMLTFARLAYPSLESLPPAADLADALSQGIAELDPVRARLLTGLVYGTGRTDLTSFDKLNTSAQARISYRLGERYETLRKWLAEHQNDVEPLDHFFQRLFGEVLAQPGFGFHRDVEAGRVIAQLIQSARTFRETLYPQGLPHPQSLSTNGEGLITHFDPPSPNSERGTGGKVDWSDSRREYLSLVNQGLLSALFVQSWQDEEIDAVFMSSTYTFLLRNRFVDYQFWVDVGSNAWSEQFEQPLTHPHVLRRDFAPDTVWTDDLEYETERELLYKVITGLARRCRKQIYLGIADLGEEGFEQRGLLLNVFQSIVRRNQPDADASLLPEKNLEDDEVA